MEKILKYLDKSLVAFLDVNDRNEALKQMIDLLDRQGKLKNKDNFYQAIVAREKIVSTGIGMGVAIPHAKLADYDDFFVAIAILKRGIDWDTLDGVAVRLIFMIGGPDNKQTQYLKILSNLTQFLKDEEIRKKMLTLNSAEAIIHLFEAGPRSSYYR